MLGETLDQQHEFLFAMQFGIEAETLDKIGVDFRMHRIYPLLLSLNENASKARQTGSEECKQEVRRIHGEMVAMLHECDIPYNERLMLTPEDLMKD